MKPQDLRITNYVNFKGRSDIDYCEIIEITKAGGCHILRNFKDGLYNDDQPEAIKDLTGILITKEWLVRFRFIKDGFLSMFWKEAWAPGHPSQRFDMYWSEQRGFIMSSRYQGFSKDLKMLNIEYIHQLQNLYFSITGSELLITQ